MPPSLADRPVRLGHEVPRIFTPPLRELTPETSLGFAVIEFAEDVIGLTLTPWQRWLFIHALEQLPDRSFRFRVILILVARQNGKSTWSQVLALFFMYVLSVALVIGTAQDLDVAEEIWQGAVEIVEANPELDALKDRVVRVNGKKSLELKTGERWKVKAANRRAGRGLSGDLILLDELREHQAWDAWGAITKTTMARPDALIAALSNAGDATSVVLRWLRKMAHASIGDPDGINALDDPSAAGEPGDIELESFEVEDDTLGIFEWSAPPGCPSGDRDGWAWANPALGYMITERTIASAWRTDPEPVFRTEVLCQWSDGALDGPFPDGTWEAGFDAESQIVGRVVACVDVSPDGDRAHIAFAGRRADGLPHVEVVASRPGHEWVVEWLSDPRRADLLDGITAQARSAPVSGLLDDWRAAGLDIVDWRLADLASATASFYATVRDGELRHRPQPLLDVAAAAGATRPAGDGLWVWDRRRSVVDVAPLVAVTGALWLLNRRPAEAAPGSVYESRGLVVM